MAKTKNKYWIYLENLKQSGVVNMFGAAPYLQKTFDLSEEEATNILSEWMKNYNEDDYKEDVE